MVRSTSPFFRARWSHHPGKRHWAGAPLPTCGPAGRPGAASNGIADAGQAPLMCGPSDPSLRPVWSSVTVRPSS